MRIVLNLNTGARYEFTPDTEPKKALIIAYATERKDYYSTVNEAVEKYSNLVVEGERVLSIFDDAIGDMTIRKAVHE